MTLRARVAAAASSVVLAGASCAAGSAAGARAPEFELASVDGRVLRLSDETAARRVVVLAFFATWSKPSTSEMPHLERLFERERARGLDVIAVAVDGPETVADVPAFARRNRLTFTVASDADSRVTSAYDPTRAVPFTVVVGRAGDIVLRHEGYNPSDEESIARAADAALSAR